MDIQDPITPHIVHVEHAKNFNTSLSPEEENVVCYASGYVPVVLKTRHEKSSSKESFLSLNVLVVWQ